MVYIVAFILSLFLFSLVLKRGDIHGTLDYLFAYLACAPVLILAMFRDSDIGTDLSFYVIPIWEDSVAWADKTADLVLKWDGIEKAYLLINFLAGKISVDLEFLLLVLQSFIMLPVLIAALKSKKYVSPVLFLFVYFFTIYNDTLNMVRQSLALSVSLLAFVYLFNGEKKKAVGFYILTLLLHGSAIVGLCVPILYFVMTSYKLSKMQIGLIVVISILSIGVLVLYAEPLMIFAMNHGLIDAKYVAYTSGEGMFGARISKSCIIYDFLILLLSYYCYKNSKSNVFMTYFFLISLMSVLFEMTGVVTSYLSRMAKYPEILSVFIIPYMLNYLESKKIAGYKVLPILVKILVIIYWIFTFVISKTGETYPYTSKILGI